jgi:hypothetical protein
VKALAERSDEATGWTIEELIVRFLTGARDVLLFPRAATLTLGLTEPPFQ